MPHMIPLRSCRWVSYLLMMELGKKSQLRSQQPQSAIKQYTLTLTVEISLNMYAALFLFGIAYMERWLVKAQMKIEVPELEGMGSGVGVGNRLTAKDRSSSNEVTHCCALRTCP